MAKDLFAPPTPEELKKVKDLYAPPSKEELEGPEPTSELKSAALGALQGGTLGFADEGEGAIRALASAPNSMDELKAKYQQYRDIARQRNEEAQKANPKSYMAGNLTGSLATAAIPGLGELNLAKAAGLGAAAGLGSSNADLTKGEVGKAALDTGVGAGIGAAGYGIGKGISNALAPDALKNRAGAAAIRGLGGKATPENISVGNEVLDQGLLPFKGGAEDIQKGITSKIGDIEQNEVQPTLAGIGQSNALPGVLANKPSMGKQVLGLVKNFTSDLTRDDADSITQNVNKRGWYWAQKLDAAQGDPQALNELRKAIDVQAREAGAFNAPAELKPLASFYGDLRKLVNNNIRDTASKVSSDAGEDLASSMGVQSNLIKAEDIAGKGIQQDLDNPPGSFGLKDLGISGFGAGALATGHPLAGAATLAAGIGKVGLENATGQSIGRTANIISARSQNFASNMLANPSGAAVMKGVTEIPKRALASTGVQSGIQSIYTAKPQVLRAAATSLQANPGTKDIGTALHTAIDNNDEDGKNRVLFAAEQLPAVRAQFRAALGEHLNGASGEDSEPDEVDNFLDRVGRNESSSGTNFNHETINSGLQKGQTAIGTFGLLPNTVREILSKTRDPKLDYLNDLDDQEMKSNLEANPDVEREVARHLAEKVLNNQGGDAEKAAFAWRHGHNLPPEKIEDKDYQNDEYVKRFNRDMANR